MAGRWAASVAMAQNASGGPARTAPTATFGGGYLLNTPGGQYENKATAAQIIEKRQSGEGWEGDKGAEGVAAINTGYADNLSRQTGIQTMQANIGVNAAWSASGPPMGMTTAIGTARPIWGQVTPAKPSLRMSGYNFGDVPIPKLRWGNPYNSEPIYPIQ